MLRREQYEFSYNIVLLLRGTRLDAEGTQLESDIVILYTQFSIILICIRKHIYMFSNSHKVAIGRRPANIVQCYEPVPVALQSLCFDWKKFLLFLMRYSIICFF